MPTICRDPDGDTLSYNFVTQTQPNGMTLNSITGHLEWTPTSAQVGAYPITIKVSDGHGWEVTQTFTLQVIVPATLNGIAYNDENRNRTRDVGEAALANWTVFLDQNSNQYLDAGERSVVTNEDGAYTIADVPPGNFQLGAVLKENWVFTGSSYPGGTVVSGETKNNLTLSFAARTAVNGTPRFVTPFPSRNATVGITYSSQALAVDPDGDNITYSLVANQFPTGMTINASTGAIRWTPIAGRSYLPNVTVKAADGRGGEDLYSFVLTIAPSTNPPSNRPPQILIPPSPITVSVVSKPYTFAIKAADPDGDLLNYTLSSTTLANGGNIAINRDNGLLTLTPTALGTYPIEILVNDQHGLAVPLSYNLEVVATESDAKRAPEILNAPGEFIELGQTYVYDMDAIDPNGTVPTYNLLAPSPRPTNVTFNSVSGRLEFTPTAAQVNQRVPFTMEATDGELSSGGTFEVLVLPANRPPVVEAILNQSVFQGATFRYDVKASDLDGQTLNYQLDAASVAAVMTIDQYGRLTWKTSSTTTLASYPVTVTVSDGRLSDQKIFQLAVVADTIRPTVKIEVVIDPVTNRRPRVGEDLVLRVFATDNVAVASRTLTLVQGTQRTPLTLDAQFTTRLRLTTDHIGVLNFEATATDSAGLVSDPIATMQVVIPDPSNTAVPIAKIANGPSFTITEPTDIQFSVSDSDSPNVSWSLTLIDNESNNEIPLRSGQIGPVSNGVYRLDSTLLRNSQYTLVLRATDGQFDAVDSSSINIEGGLKMGNFTISFTDLSVPVSGVPLSVTRTYDSLDASLSRDFGYGWKMDIQSTKVQVQMDPNREMDFGGNKPYKNGDRVIVTLADGTKHGFTFFAKGVGQLGIFTHYIPTFIPDQGVKSQLLVGSNTLQKSGEDFYLDLDSPRGLLFGTKSISTYQMLLRNGSTLLINGEKGDLEEINDRNNNVTKFVRDTSGAVVEINSSSGRKVIINRDSFNRISEIIDPRGKKIIYAYDYNGDLISVTNRVNAMTKFTYKSDRPHYLDNVIDALERTAVTADYAADGRVNSVKGANGQTTSLGYNVNNRTQTVTDALLHTTTQTLDARGNVVREVDATGVITKRTFTTREGKSC